MILIKRNKSNSWHCFSNYCNYCNGSGWYLSFPVKNSNVHNNWQMITGGNRIAVIDTTMGTIRVELYEDKMPITTANFIKLANDGFYNGMIFHRVKDNFMIQAGRYFPDGTQKSSPYGNIQFEESDVTHVDGAISMASTGAKVGGSAEFFICDGAQSWIGWQLCCIWCSN